MNGSRLYRFSSVAIGVVTFGITLGCGNGSVNPPLESAMKSSPSTSTSLSSSPPSTLTRFRSGNPQMEPYPSDTERHGMVVSSLREPLRPSEVAFVSDLAHGFVYIVDAQGKPIARLAGFSYPDALATDTTGNLYVADYGNSRVSVLAPPYNRMPTILKDPGQHPFGVAVDVNGDVAVTSINNTQGGPGNIAFYAAGSTTPTSTITDAAFGPFFCAFDSHGNLYLDGLSPNYATLVGEIVGGVSGTSISLLTVDNRIEFPGGVQVTKSGEIAILDQDAAPPQIDSYNPPIGGRLGSPITTTLLTGAVDPINFSFNESDRVVLAGDAGLGQGEEYRYPVGGLPIVITSLPARTEAYDAVTIGIRPYVLSAPISSATDNRYVNRLAAQRVFVDQ